jgi:hypothetical protein
MSNLPSTCEKRVRQREEAFEFADNAAYPLSTQREDQSSSRSGGVKRKREAVEPTAEEIAEAFEFAEEELKEKLLIAIRNSATSLEHVRNVHEEICFRPDSSLRSSLKTSLRDSIIRSQDRVRFRAGTKERDGPSPLLALWDRFVWDICAGLMGNPHDIVLQMSQLEYRPIEDDLSTDSLEAIFAAIEARNQVISHGVELKRNVDDLLSKNFSPPSSPRAGSHSPLHDATNYNEIDDDDGQFKRAVLLGKRLGEEALGIIKPSIKDCPSLPPSLTALCGLVFRNYANSDRLLLRGMHWLSIDLLNRLETALFSVDQRRSMPSEGPPRGGRSVGLIFRHSRVASTSVVQLEGRVIAERDDDDEGEGEEEEKEEGFAVEDDDGRAETTEVNEDDDGRAESTDVNSTVNVTVLEKLSTEHTYSDTLTENSPFDSFLDCLSSSPVAEAAAENYRAKTNLLSIPILPLGGGTCSKVGPQHQSVLRMLVLLTQAATLSYPV